MARTQPAVPTPLRTLYVNIDPSHVRSLAARLSGNTYMALLDGGCDTGLLGEGWYILSYTGRFANIVGFDEFIAKKSGLPIVTGVTKCTLPNCHGTILLRHHEGVYNKGSKTTLLSEFQLRSRGCMVASTSSLHRGIDGQPGTQRLVTPSDDGGEGYTLPLALSDALMTIQITMPTSDDLETLPIVDITPEGVWVPSEYNDDHPGLSFGDTCFLAQTSQSSPCPNEPNPADVFHDAIEPNDDATDTFHHVGDSVPFPDGGHYFDPADYTEGSDTCGRAFHLTLDGKTSVTSDLVDQFLMSISHEELRGDHETFDSFAYVSRAAIVDRAKEYVEYLGYRPVIIIRKTLENTSQLAHTIL